MAEHEDIIRLVEQTPFADTHEHFFEESDRLKGQAGTGDLVLCDDFSILFCWYDDFIAGGMPPEDQGRFLSPDTDVDEKWRLLAPHYEKVCHTGYFRAVRESVRMLYGEEDLNEDTYRAISEKVAAGVEPGFYRRVLTDVSNVKHAQVASVEDPVFKESEQPDLIYRTMTFGSLSAEIRPDAVATLSKRAGREVKALEDWHTVVDWAFAEYGPRVVALKSTVGYFRRLDFADVPAEDAAGPFERFLADPDGMAAGERKALEDHLFHYCVRRAAERGLPVKLHTGYHTGTGYMELNNVSRNMGDACTLLQTHPDVPFVLMHISYPYHDEAIAVAKHYANAYIDMCWAWIINPAVCVRFVKEFLMAAPANKMLTFGGDYGAVENVPGHARVARMGLAQALGELVGEGWLDRAELEPLVRRLMYGNAEELFDYEGALANSL